MSESHAQRVIGLLISPESLAMYFEDPREPDQIDMELAATFTQTAGIIIWQHLQAPPASMPG